MRWRRPGLRAQFVARAAGHQRGDARRGRWPTLVPPLEHRLATDRLRDMRELARHRRPRASRACRARDLRRGSARQDAVVRELERRMGGRVALFDAHGIELADTDPERREPRSATPERLVDAGFARAGDVRDQVSDGEAVVVAPVRTRAGPAHARAAQVAATTPTRPWRSCAGALPVAGGVAILHRRRPRDRAQLRAAAPPRAPAPRRAPAGRRGDRAAAGGRRLPRRGGRGRARARDDALAAARRGARAPGLPRHRLARAAHAAGVAARHRRTSGGGARARRAGSWGDCAGAPPQLGARPIG